MLPATIHAFIFYDSFSLSESLSRITSLLITVLVTVDVWLNNDSQVYWFSIRNDMRSVRAPELQYKVLTVN